MNKSDTAFKKSSFIKNQNRAEQVRRDMLGKIYRDFKGGLYIVKDIAIDSNTSECVVIYTCYDNHSFIWARSLEEFFSEVDKTKYPSSTQDTRFEELNIS